MDHDSKKFQELRKEIEEKVNNELDTEISILIKDESIDRSEIINNLHLNVLENDLYNKYNCINSNKQTDIQKKQEVWLNLNSLDIDNFELLMENLSSKSIIAKLKDLEKLLNTQVIDTKQGYWQHLSKVLRQCLLNMNNEIYLRTLKVHYKIISFSPTCYDGYINLLKGGLILLRSTENQGTSKQDTFHIRAVKVLQLVLETQQHVFQSILHMKQNSIAELITLFLSFINYENMHTTKSMIEYVCIFDKDATWFNVFCFSSFIRNIFINILLDNVNILKFVINNFYKTLNNRDFVDEANIKYFFHNIHFLTYFVNYKENLNYFPLTLKVSKRIKLQDLLELMVLKINEKHINSEVKEMLKKSVSSIYANNPNLLTNYVLSILVEPFKSCDNSSALKNIQENKHIIDILNAVSKSDNNILFNNLNKFHKPITKRYQMKMGGISFRDRLNCPQVIIDYAVLLLNICIKSNEDLNEINQETLLILNTCKNIYKNNSVSTYYINPTKLIISLKNMYQVLYNYENNHNKQVLELFIVFFEYFNDIFEIFDDEILLQQMFDDIFLFFDVKELRFLLCNISNNKIGYNKVKNSHNCVIKTEIEKIWHIQENEELVDSNLIEEEIDRFIINMFLLKYNYKLIHALLTFENENTIIAEETEFCTVLSDLLEKCLESCEDNVENYIGLLLLKVFIINLDLQLHLLSNYKIQEKITQIRENCRLSELEYNNDELPILIDRCNVLRHNILMSIKHIGFITSSLHENISSLTQLLIGSSQPSSPLNQEDANTINEFQLFLMKSETGLHDNNWILQARKIFKISCNESHNISLISILMQRVPKTVVYRKIDLTWPPPDSVYYQFFSEDFAGISIIISYGVKTSLLNSSGRNEDNLKLLLQQSRAFISYQPESFQNFDWFVGIIFLISGGDLDKCKNTLMNVVNTQVTSLIWCTFGSEFDLAMQNNFYQQLTILLEEIKPVVYSALKMLGISPIILAKQWLQQCFFNILEFEEICNFLIATVLYPPEFIIFYLIAVFDHIKLPLCTCTHTATIDNMLKVAQIGNFKLKNYFDYIEKLINQYKNIIKF